MVTTHVRRVESPQPAKKQRRPSRTKDASKERLIDATVHLLKTHSVADLSVRQIALHADVNHGLVHLYFGSKGSLLLAVAQRLLVDSVSAVNQDTGGEIMIDQLAPEMEATVKILVWLMMTGEEVPTSHIIGTLVTSVGSQLMSRDGISTADAEIAAVLTISVSLGWSVHHLMQSAQDRYSVEDSHQLFRHLMHLLAANPFRPAT